MNMATPRNWLHIRLIQARRRYARKRMLKDLGWRRAWDKAYGR